MGRRRDKKSDEGSKKKLWIPVSILLIGAACAGGAWYYFNYMNKPQEVAEIQGEVIEQQAPKKIEVFDVTSKERPVAVMLDNNVDAWPHSGLNKAYAIYEIEIEGGESRLMALFKDKKDIEKVGPIRSARHYFLDYALENDALYAHIGQSPKAESDLKTLNMPDINGQLYDSLSPRNKSNTKEFWRQNGKDRPHDAYTSIQNIFNIAESDKYRVTSDKKPVFKYSVKEVNLENGQSAYTITAGYHAGNMTKFQYNPDTKTYTKTSKGILQKDELTKENHSIKNLIVLNAPITNLPDRENKGRKDVKTVGTNTGYFITNGKAIKIKAVKDSRTAQTKYMDLDGNEIEVNDGQTYVMITPMDIPITVTPDPNAATTAEKDEE